MGGYERGSRCEADEQVIIPKKNVYMVIDVPEATSVICEFDPLPCSKQYKHRARLHVADMIAVRLADSTLSIMRTVKMTRPTCCPSITVFCS